MKSIILKQAIIHLSESKAVCPYCNRKIPFEDIEDEFMKQEEWSIQLKCKCKKIHRHYV